MAKEAVPSLSVIGLFCEESPVDGYSSWVSDDGFDHAPEEHEEEDVEDDKDGDVPFGMEIYHEAVDENDVVADDEDQDSNEMRVY